MRIRLTHGRSPQSDNWDENKSTSRLQEGKVRETAATFCNQVVVCMYQGRATDHLDQCGVSVIQLCYKKKKENKASGLK